MSSPFAGDAALERDRLAQSRKRNERPADQDHRIPRQTPGQAPAARGTLVLPRTTDEIGASPAREADAVLESDRALIEERLKQWTFCLRTFSGKPGERDHQYFVRLDAKAPAHNNSPSNRSRIAWIPRGKLQQWLSVPEGSANGCISIFRSSSKCRQGKKKTLNAVR